MSTLFSFEGPEFYIRSWPQLVGKTFRTALFSFDAAVPIGVKMNSR
jgi:hypothetical protein